MMRENLVFASSIVLIVLGVMLLQASTWGLMWYQSCTSTILLVFLFFSFLFSVLYLSLLTGKPVRSLKEPIRPKISQIQALDIVLADAKRLDARVNDLRLFVSLYNFSSSDFEEHPEH